MIEHPLVLGLFVCFINVTGRYTHTQGETYYYYYYLPVTNLCGRRLELAMFLQQINVLRAVLRDSDQLLSQFTVITYCSRAAAIKTGGEVKGMREVQITLTECAT